MAVRYRVVQGTFRIDKPHRWAEGAITLREAA